MKLNYTIHVNNIDFDYTHTSTSRDGEMMDVVYIITIHILKDRNIRNWL